MGADDAKSQKEDKGRVGIYHYYYNKTKIVDVLELKTKNKIKMLFPLQNKKVQVSS